VSQQLRIKEVAPHGEKKIRTQRAHWQSTR